MTASPARSASLPDLPRRTARAVTEAFAPSVLLILVLLAVGWQATPDRGRGHGLGWAALTAFLCSVLPYAFVHWGVRNERWADRHIPRRDQRLIPFLFAMACVVTAIALLSSSPGAPRDLLALATAMVVGLSMTLLITLSWKISVHTAVASGVTAVLLVTYGPVLLWFVPVPVLTAWSRVTLKDHTPVQTVAGAVVGATVATAVYRFVR
ncbi:phosphatase PAP2 family protein [Streptomyces longisporoflavus]|uniref:Phosphatase PAP2 family protein n=1 Tax=Streptomyces longisporoflavus TaxID=28044 RepID=A0ABW7QGB3_9ACTN